GIEVIPEGLQLWVVEVSPRCKAGIVPVGDRAQIAVRCQVGQEPLLLLAPGATSTDTWLGAFAVQGDDVPGSEVKAVVATGDVASQGAKVGEVARCSGRLILVIPEDRVGNALEAAPGWVVGMLKPGQ